MANASTKKQLVDFLWEWAENNGDWGKLLVCKIVATEQELTNNERSEVFDYFLQSISLKTGLPSVTIAKPVYSPSSKKIELTSLSDVTGVNKLAKGQSILFGKNLTVIFGENGAGKTGYGRILKALGYSYDGNNNILCDIDKATEPQTATIQYKVDNEVNSFSWTSGKKNPDLNNLSVFNNNCVTISLADGRGLLVSPIGFHLFNLITSELNALSQLLQQEIDKYPTGLTWIANLHNGTAQQQFITTLKNTSSVTKLTELSTFNASHFQTLQEKQEQLKNLNKTLIETELENLQRQKNEIDSLISTIKKTSEEINEANWQNLLSISKRIKELENTTITELKDLAKQNSIQLYDSKQFKSFISAADEYLKILNLPDYPSDTDKCIYCKQDLSSKKAVELLRAYKSILHDNTQNLIKEQQKSRETILNAINKLDPKITFHQYTFGKTEQGKPAQPAEVVKYNQELNAIRKLFLAEIVEDSLVTYDYSPVITFLTSKQQSLITQIQERDADLKGLSIREQVLNQEIFELLDRQLLSTNVEAVKTAMTNRGIVSKLISNKSLFNTNAVSRKTTEAREELMQQNFTNIFQQELNALRKSHITVQLNFGTTRGQSKLQQKIKDRYILTEILSEGEQKAIALAEFLTELQLDNSMGPVIFDDPVNSLDHHIIEDVSRRLMRLSSTRQVVIFTHNILLFNSLLHEKELPIYGRLESKFYDIKAEYGFTGIIRESEAESTSVRKHVSKINSLIQGAKSSGRPENDVAAEGYGELRSAIELSVELVMFQGAVKRYKKNVSLGIFSKVNGLKIDNHKGKLNEIYERCCGFTNAHSNPMPITTEPKLVDLQTDLTSFNTILADFK
jgi:energy-coupling factor transporter ATP-binding protein EcfA2